jgi:hypothetical protein
LLAGLVAALADSPALPALQVGTVQKFRKGLPPKSSVYVAKNTLMKVAIAQTQGWEQLADKGCTVRHSPRACICIRAACCCCTAGPRPAAQCRSTPLSAVRVRPSWPSGVRADNTERWWLVCTYTSCGADAKPTAPLPVHCSALHGSPCAAARSSQGENAWVFVDEEEIADVVKHYFKFEEELFTEAKKQAAKNQEVKPPTELSAAVMSGQYLTPAEVRKRLGVGLMHVRGRGRHRCQHAYVFALTVCSSRSARTCRPRHNSTPLLRGSPSSQRKSLRQASRWCPQSLQLLFRRSPSLTRTRARLWARSLRRKLRAFCS